MSHGTESSSSTPFSCCFCNQSFRRKGDLSRHMKKHASDQHFCCVYENCHWNGTSYRRDKLVDHVVSHHKETRESAKQFVKNSTPNSRNDEKHSGTVGRREKNLFPPAYHLRRDYVDEVELYRPTYGLESWTNMDIQAGYGQAEVLTDAHFYGGQTQQPRPHGLSTVSASANINWHGPSSAPIETRRNFRCAQEPLASSDRYSTSMLDDDGSLEYRWSAGLEGFESGSHSKSCPMSEMRRRGTR